MSNSQNLVKNSFGVSYVIGQKESFLERIGTYAGSSLNRKKQLKSKDNRRQRENEVKEERKKRENKLSPRSKSKIRTKIHALTGVISHLVFVTLTFSNKVEDQVAIKCLKKFLNNVRKRKPEFEYIWVAEKQTKNKAFENNIHFHLITNVYWDIKKWWNYWIEVQESFGIVQREGTKKASSAFDVRKIKASDTKKIGSYVAGYLNKSEDSFDCPVWNCSKRISRLYTAFYSGTGFIDQLKRLEAANLLGGNIKTIVKEWCHILLIPFNKTTQRFYQRIHDTNKALWNGEKGVKQCLN